MNTPIIYTVNHTDDTAHVYQGWIVQMSSAPGVGSFTAEVIFADVECFFSALTKIGWR